MNTIAECLAEYKNPSNLKDRVLTLLNNDMYIHQTDEYIKYATSFYDLAEAKGDWNTKYEILCHWLLLSNFKDPSSLKILKDVDNTFVFHLFSKNNIDSPTKYRLYQYWYTLISARYADNSSFHTNMAICLLRYIVDATIYPEALRRRLNGNELSYNVSEIYNFNTNELINILYEILPKIQKNTYLDSPTLDINEVINVLDLGLVEELTGVKLFRFIDYLNTDNINKIGYRYYNEKFNVLLSNATAMGVTDCVDYWIQSLPSHTSTPSNLIDLPAL